MCGANSLQQGAMEKPRPDRLQVVLGIWVVIGLLVLAVVVVHSLP
jgi:hypothetical protein